MPGAPRVVAGRGAEDRPAAGGMARAYELLGRPRDRARIDLGALDAAHRSGHLDSDAAESLLEAGSEEMGPVRREPALLRVELGRTAVEAERLGVLADARHRHDRVPVRPDRLQDRHVLVVDERIGGPALA